MRRGSLLRQTHYCRTWAQEHFVKLLLANSLRSSVLHSFTAFFGITISSTFSPLSNLLPHIKYFSQHVLNWFLLVHLHCELNKCLNATFMLHIRILLFNLLSLALSFFQPIIPMFTQNVREGFRSLGTLSKWRRKFRSQEAIISNIHTDPAQDCTFQTHSRMNSLFVWVCTYLSWRTWG